MTNRELAERAGGVDDSAVAQAVRRLTRRIQENAGLDRAFQDSAEGDRATRSDPHRALQMS